MSSVFDKMSQKNFNWSQVISKSSSYKRDECNSVTRIHVPATRPRDTGFEVLNISRGRLKKRTEIVFAAKCFNRYDGKRLLGLSVEKKKKQKPTRRVRPDRLGSARNPTNDAGKSVAAAQTRRRRRVVVALPATRRAICREVSAAHGRRYPASGVEARAIYATSSRVVVEFTPARRYQPGER